MQHDIPFNRPFLVGKEITFITEALQTGKFSGDGPFTKKCHEWLRKSTGAHSALLTHSCTGALEMAAILCQLKPGDEIIMPSYTFVSTANAFVLRGAIPVFVDIRPDTLNLDETLVEEAVTPCTKAIVPVHYAGVSCEMDVILDIARRHSLRVVEDAAQGYLSTYKGRLLGTLGDFGTYSFHETKNVTSGEGGALLINNAAEVLAGEIVREKGTDRSRFFRGEVDKYTWQSMGSSYLPAEIVAAFLYAQLSEAENINAMRMRVWNRYHANLAAAERRGWLRRPVIPSHCGHNAHMYYILLDEHFDRQTVLTRLSAEGIHAVFHYVPLHSAPAGKRFCHVHGTLRNTDQLSERLVRLPLWGGMTEEHVDRVISVLLNILGSC